VSGLYRSPQADALAAGGHAPRPPRKNLLLGATIEAGALKAPVRLRNLSSSGAMLEGAVLPDPGVSLVLHRSDIRMGATVVWHVQGRCGVRFDETSISVDEWVAGVRTPSFRGQQGQARVDAIQDAVRTGSLPAEAPVPASARLSVAELEARVAEEIIYVRRLLDELGEDVADDPIVLQRHMRALQNLDRASQMLEHLGAILSAPDRLAAAEAVKMQELRTRLLRKPNFG
jgi:hypothetical protein